MILATTLLLLGLVAALLPVRLARAFSALGAVLLVNAVLLDALTPAALLPLADAMAEAVGRVGPLGIVGDAPVGRALLLAALVWSGPAGDLVVRAVLEATGLPAPERAAEAGFRAGRWVGRLERWTLVVVVAAGAPELALIPAGGKALLRYAEAVADARAARDARLAVPGAAAERPPGRDAFLDYVLVGSLASWSQALLLGLLAAA